MLDQIEKHTYARVIFAFCIVFALNLSVLTQPPVWTARQHLSGSYLSLK
jgi:hypothetical protein